MRVPAPFALSLLLACGGSIGSEKTDSDASTDPGGADADPGTTECTGFAAEATSFSLPSTLPVTSLSSMDVEAFLECAEGAFRARVFDLTGDGALDLVVTDHCDVGGVGTSHWLVFAGEAGGFADAAITWPLPPGLQDDQLNRTEVLISSVCETGVFTATIRDLDGDARPDLVITDDCDDATGVGTTAWRVHQNTGSGFDADATSWTVPNLGPDYLRRMEISMTTPCVDGTFSLTTVDLTGDGRLDLAQTDNCDAQGVGTSHWLVYAGKSGGFEVTPAQFALPDIFAEIEMRSLRTSASSVCDSGEQLFAVDTRDIDGDGFLDLVVTDNCDDKGTGTIDWKVYPGNGSQFSAAATSWTLPTHFETDWMRGLDVTIPQLCAEPEKFIATTKDVDGDGRLDLVVTDNCDTQDVGSSRWLFYPGQSAGFALQHRDWLLPGGYDDDELSMTSMEQFCGSRYLRTATLDVDGDGQLELIVTDDCKDNGVGDDHWLVYDTSCGPAN